MRKLWGSQERGVNLTREYTQIWTHTLAVPTAVCSSGRKWKVWAGTWIERDGDPPSWPCAVTLCVLVEVVCLQEHTHKCFQRSRRCLICVFERQHQSVSPPLWPEWKYPVHLVYQNHVFVQLFVVPTRWSLVIFVILWFSFCATSKFKFNEYSMERREIYLKHLCPF